VNSSSYDRTLAFLRGRYQRHPAAAIAMGLSMLWSIWVIYYVVDHRGGAGWYLLLRGAISEIGTGVLLAAVFVWLVGLVFDDSR
jgi:hypothetical protein